MINVKFLKFSNRFRWLLLGLLLALGACTGSASTPVPPGQKSDAGYGTVCKAGIYSCNVPYPVPLGSPCSCSGLGAASYGIVQAK
ncbi:hypothetical protein COMNV_01297 [Commensalibacter sp. Nvir]|uniref:hypothetical protein n=1 Tax=Commensalibacter sp. Nvir TaxID=3069817 RepID=UPI002D5F17A9|nr:hypothetical protein COMNV_01297 [Commensalibacter sp. Nvir]